MTSGFLMPLVADLKVENGEFSWDREVPRGALNCYPRSPIDFHDNLQVAGTPLYDEDRFIIKFNNFWTIELPPGYSLLVTHPINRHDLPFHTLTGLVDADRYVDNFVHFPARWCDPDFNGVLPAGTPVAQCLPVKRDNWISSSRPSPVKQPLGCTKPPPQSAASPTSIGGNSAHPSDKETKR